MSSFSFYDVTQMNSLCEHHLIRMNRRVLDRAAREATYRPHWLAWKRSCCFLCAEVMCIKSGWWMVSHRSEIKMLISTVRQLYMYNDSIPLRTCGP
eukprot:scaffold22699_cov78-Skeletonema_dohrnii-CCMP3373.AAC.1